MKIPIFLVGRQAGDLEQIQFTEKSPLPEGIIDNIHTPGFAGVVCGVVGGVVMVWVVVCRGWWCVEGGV